MFLYSSNAQKLAEYARFGLRIPARIGPDLPEVAGSVEEVIIYKALAAGPEAVVEDTVLVVNDQPLVDIRWRLEELSVLQGAKATWLVSLGYYHQNTISLYQGRVHGTLHLPSQPKGFGFDPFFVPTGYTQTLAELDALGQKDQTSARAGAINNLVCARPYKQVMVADIQPWTGGYQHD